MTKRTPVRAAKSAIAAIIALAVCIALLAAAQDAQPKPEAIQRMAADADPSFEVVTVKLSDPDERNDGFDMKGRHLLIKNETVEKMLTIAYGVHPKQVVGAPVWTWTVDDTKAATETDAAPGFFTAFQEQLGLRLEAVKAPADAFVIDHLERPTPN